MEPDDVHHLLSYVKHCTHKDWAREKRSESLCFTTTHFLSLEYPSPVATNCFYFFPLVQNPQLSDILTLAAIRELHHTDHETILLIHQPPNLPPGNNTPHISPSHPRVSTSRDVDGPLGATHVPHRHLLPLGSSGLLLAHFLWWICMAILSR